MKTFMLRWEISGGELLYHVVTCHLSVGFGSDRVKSARVRARVAAAGNRGKTGLKH